MYQQICALLALALLSVATAQAETVRCSGKIVEEGMQQTEVRQFCGSPDEQDLINDYAWIYRKDGSGLDKSQDVVIHFYPNGHVRYIETVDQYESN